MITKHLKQAEARADQTRFKFWLAGRRGGKTTGLRDDMTSAIRAMPNNSGLLYMGPTNQMAKELIWNALEEKLEERGWHFKAKVSDQRFEFTRGRFIQVLGAEKVRRVRGQKYYRAYLDEVAFYTVSLKEIWRAVRPTLSDFQGGAVLATTPNGKGTEAYDFYLDILKNPVDWKYFHWKTIDNPFISSDEIEAARRELDEKSFRQEYEAGWESFEGLAYYCFEESTHLKPCSQFNWSLGQIGISLDFNVNPTTLIVDQKVGNHIYFRKEYSQKNSSTEATVRSFCEDFKAQRENLIVNIYGDASGSNRKSTTGRSDYHYVQEMLKAYGFNFRMCVRPSNPAIIDRVAYANAYLKNAKGETRVTIDPSCKELIRDLSSQPLEGRFPSDKNNLGHKADAFGYRIYWDQIVGNRGEQSTIQI